MKDTFIARAYVFTAERTRNYRPYSVEETFNFTGLVFPGGEVLVLNPDNGDEWYASLGAVEVCDAEIVSVEPTGKTVTFSQADLADSLQQAVDACKAVLVNPAKVIPATLHKYAGL